MSYIDNLNASIAEHQRIIDAGLPESAQAAQIIAQHQAEIARVQGDSGGGSAPAYSYGDDPETRRMRDQQAWEDARAAAENKRQQDQLIQTLNAAFKEYGLESLYGKIEEYVRKDYNADAISMMLRDTSEYQARFPAMKALSDKKRAITEGEYIAFERNAAQLERSYGLPSGMLGPDAVTRLLTNEVSAKELEDRVVMAAAASYSVDATVRDQFQKFYGIGSGGLAAYFLDPERATPLLNKQFVSSQIGAEAARQAIEVGAQTAEELQALGVTVEAAREGFGKVAGQQSLTQGRGDIVTQNDLIGANLKGSEQARKDLERAIGGRLGRFQGGGEFLTTQQGAVGLGSAAT